MKYFVSEDSVVRRIWGKGDTILLIFAGAAAEFALNKAVDWLYFTGRLPSDPLKRLFSTVTYAREIVFSEYGVAISAIDRISSIHRGVEVARGMAIPDWAYRDVLFMLIDYSIRSHELLEQPLSMSEREEVFYVFRRMGERMGIPGLPADYLAWETARLKVMEEDMVNSAYTIDLYRQYRKHLGWFRYKLLLEAQKALVPGEVNVMLRLGGNWQARLLFRTYRSLSHLRLQNILRNAILPGTYRKQVAELDR